MKVTSKGRYALRALFDIAYFSPGSSCQVKEIAERQDIPFRFLEQIFQDLKRAGLVASKRGPQGGFTLERPNAEIRVGDVLRAVESSPSPNQEGTTPTSPAQLIDQTFDELALRADALFDAVTLEQLCDKAKGLGLGTPREARHMYSI